MNMRGISYLGLFLLITACSKQTSVQEQATQSSTKVMAVSPTSSLQPSSVLIVYNSNYTLDDDQDGVQDSLEVANYYAARRGIPSANILGIAPSDSADVPSYAELQSAIIQPIKTKLSSL